MATVDTSIAQNIRLPQFDTSRFESPVTQFSNALAIQGAQQANQLRNMQMAAARREEASQNAIARAYQKGMTPEGNLDYEIVKRELASGGQGAQIPGILKAQKEAQKLELEGQSARNKLVTEKLALSRDALDRIDPRSPTAAQDYLAWHNSNHADPVLGPYLQSIGADQQQAFQRINQAVNTGKLPELIEQSKLGVTKFQELHAPKLQEVNLGGKVGLVDFNSRSGTYGQEVKSFEKTKTGHELTQEGFEERRLGLEGKRVGLEGRRVALQEEESKRAKDPVYQAKLSQAKAEGEALAKNGAAAQQILPKVETVAQTTLDNLDAMIGKRDAKGNLLKGQKPHPGFTDAVGMGLPLRFIPGTSAADFQTRFDQVKGETFLQAFETLKGGGAITNIEGEKGTAAINRMSLAQSEKDFVAAAQDLKAIINKGLENARAKAAKAEQSRVSAGNAAPPPPAGFRPD
jgi:hypothetical protein